MARTVAELPAGSRLTDHISLGVIARYFPLERVTRILDETGRAGQRRRILPGHVVVYCVIALALYMQVSCREVLRCLLDGLQWLQAPGARIRVTGKSGISQARTRLGYEPVMVLHDQVVKPLATKRTKGAWYRSWRLVSLDGSTMDMADTQANRESYGRPGASRGRSTYPQLRFVSLVENGTHGLYGLLLAHYAIRGLMHEAAVTGNRDPDTLSFTHAVRIVRRTLPHFVSIPSSGETDVS